MVDNEGTATDLSVDCAIRTLISEARASIEDEAGLDSDDEDALVPEAPLDGKPSDEQYARIQSEVDARLDRHAILLYAQDEEGAWSIGILSLAPII